MAYSRLLPGVIALVGATGVLPIFAQVGARESRCDISLSKSVAGGPENLDTSWKRLSAGNVFRVSILPLTGGRSLLPLNTVHNWTVRVEVVGDGPLDGAHVDFVGGMPAHDHGFPTVPRVTRSLGNGTYLLEGVKFNMTGWWQFVFCVRTAQSEDLVRFNIKVGPWSTRELRILKSLWIGELGRPQADPSNRYADNKAAAQLGRRLFFETWLSRNGEFSCASCHEPRLYFTDAQPRSTALGVTRRHAPSVLGIAYSGWFYWDGSRDSLWSQALTPLERAAELGLARTEAVRLVTQDPKYREPYGELFGESADFSDLDRFPSGASPVGDMVARSAWLSMMESDRDLVNRAFSNLGKAIAAFERILVPSAARFDRYVEQLEHPKQDEVSILSEVETHGLRLFISDRLKCLRCHNGPLFTNHGFHNTGVPQVDPNDPDFGRSKGVEEALADEFNCLGRYSDAVPEQCVELGFVKKTGEDLMGAFKVPSLRNVAETAPYMHAGQYKTLREVLEHYSRPPAQNIGHIELTTLNLKEDEMDALEAFLRTLTSEVAPDPKWLPPPDH